jgi:DNA polymerase-3 subunit alpha
MFTPLGIKTDYSILKSLIKVDDYIMYGINNHLNTLGILDNNLNSSHYFYNQCIKNNIKPIIGIDINIDNYRIFLYPKNYNGLVNLFKLPNNISISDLENYNKDIICILPYESYNLYEVVSKIYEIVFLSFKNNDEYINANIITNKTIYIKDTLVINSNNAKYINYLNLIENNKKLGEAELLNQTDKIIEILDYNTNSLTDLIDIKFPNMDKYIPIFDENIDSINYLKTLSYKGLEKRLSGKVTEVYKNRLDYELKVIIDMGFTDYFLIVFDYVRFAIKNKICVGVGRGSAAGSLVAYSLGITWIDPIKYDLLFERFLNPERVTLPDIDIDFEDDRREEVVDYVKQRYGDNRVAKIIAYGTMTAKDVLRTVAKINNVNDENTNALLKLINSKKTLKENYTDEVKELLRHNSILKKVYEESIPLEGLKKHTTIHAAGIVICSDDLTNHLPIITSNGENLTGYTKEELEELGLIKMDFLSVRNLTIMSDVLKSIDKPININEIPTNDSKVYELFSSADTVGIFQFESIGMKNFLKRLKPTCFDDLVLSIAIYRPGPMQYIDTFIKRKQGKEKVTFPDESLSYILSPTYGILVYQEQIMEILKFMASFSYAEADIIRRAISKKNLNIIESTRDKFISKSISNGYTEEVANNVYEMIVKFAGFGFNKSHSVAYAYIAYQMAYLKVHYKESFYINLLNSNINGESKTKEYIEEAKKNNISILKPDINLSQSKYSIESDGIRLPLRIIKGVGTVVSDAIISSRGTKPFKDFYDFVARTNINKNVIENLILAGVFDSFGYNRATLLKNINASLNYAELVRGLDESLVNKPVMVSTIELPEYDLIQHELDLFGFYVSTHPASKYPKVMKQINIESFFNKIVETVILIDKIRVIKTKKNKDMAFIIGSDETTSNEFIFFDNCNISELHIGDLIKVEGIVERRLDKYQIVVRSFEKL